MGSYSVTVNSCHVQWISDSNLFFVTICKFSDTYSYFMPCIYFGALVSCMCVVLVHEFLVCVCIYVCMRVKCVGNAVVTYTSK